MCAPSSSGARGGLLHLRSRRLRVRGGGCAAGHVRGRGEVDIFLEALSLLIESPKPTVAAVHGMALGGGQAMVARLRFRSGRAWARASGNVEMAYGFPAAMNIALLTRQIGRRRGLEIAMDRRPLHRRAILRVRPGQPTGRAGRADGGHGGLRRHTHGTRALGGPSDQDHLPAGRGHGAPRRAQLRQPAEPASPPERPARPHPQPQRGSETGPQDGYRRRRIRPEPGASGGNINWFPGCGLRQNILP